MQYVSTRGMAEPLPFEEVLLTGLAPDGGLYVPESWPQIDRETWRGWTELSYPALAEAVMQPFIGDYDRARFRRLIDEAYLSFAHHSVAPLRQIGPSTWLMELFHGPTLAFKDIALQLVGRLFDDVLARRGGRVTVLGATSGDTGSAAIAACRDRPAIDIVILHPRNRVSEVQRRQMTTVLSANVHNIAIEGSFDDCQALVKAAFNDAPFRAEMRLAAVNSINWARLMAQVVYYVHAVLQLGGLDRPVGFTVPTGNFGDIFAGYVAHRMGLPIAGLRIATNANDILHRFMTEARYAPRPALATMSPSMDVQVASNFERLLFEMLDRDGAAVRGCMDSLAQSGAFGVPDAAMASVRSVFDSASTDEAATAETIARVARETGILIDPHTAVAVAAAPARAGDGAEVVLGTAAAAKFPDAVERASGRRPRLPAWLDDLYEREERCDVLANDLAALRRHMRRTLGEGERA